MSKAVAIGIDHSFKLKTKIMANYEKLTELNPILKSKEDADCIQFMDYIREQVTEDKNHFFSGLNNSGCHRVSMPYFSPIIHVQWNHPGLWCFVLYFVGELEGRAHEILHAWCVEKREAKKEKIYMTHKVENTIVPYARFENIFQHIQYDEWFKSILSMASHIKSNGMDKVAVEMYFSIFGVAIQSNDRKDLVLLWKCYDWKN